jgi:hypothetical protein
VEMKKWDIFWKIREKNGKYSFLQMPELCVIFAFGVILFFSAFLVSMVLMIISFDFGLLFASIFFGLTFILCLFVGIRLAFLRVVINFEKIILNLELL